jgi:hypothetical protein
MEALSVKTTHLEGTWMIKLSGELDLYNGLLLGSALLTVVTSQISSSV